MILIYYSIPTFCSHHVLGASQDSCQAVMQSRKLVKQLTSVYSAYGRPDNHLLLQKARPESGTPVKLILPP